MKQAIKLKFLKLNKIVFNNGIKCIQLTIHLTNGELLASCIPMTTEGLMIMPSFKMYLNLGKMT